MACRPSELGGGGNKEYDARLCVNKALPEDARYRKIPHCRTLRCQNTPAPRTLQEYARHLGRPRRDNSKRTTTAR
eukprot:5822090-Alexandrium_andersonii.AAC.1